MGDTLITPSFTSLYGQTEIDPLSLHALAGDYSEDIDIEEQLDPAVANLRQVVGAGGLQQRIEPVTHSGAASCGEHLVASRQLPQDMPCLVRVEGVIHGVVEAVGVEVQLEAVAGGQDHGPVQRGAGSTQLLGELLGREVRLVRDWVDGVDVRDLALAEAGLHDVRMLLQVHDELVFEMPEARVEAATPVIRQVMADAALPAVALTVPLGVEIGTGLSWDAAH